MTDPVYQKPGWVRLFASFFYDGLLILAFWLLGTFVLAIVISPSHQELETGLWSKLFYWLFLLGIPWLFFTWFWVHGGQTLGMRAWRLKAVTRENQSIKLDAASKRFAIAWLEWLAIGLLLLPVYVMLASVSKDWKTAVTVYLVVWIVGTFIFFAWSCRWKHGSLHDRVSKTRLVQY